MALVLRLSDLAQATTYDLLSGVLRLVEGSWETMTPTADSDFKALPYGGSASFKGYGRVSESLGLVGADSVVNLLTAVNAIEAFQELARRWSNDLLNTSSAWLEFNANGEEARRSFIYDLMLKYSQMTGVSPTLAYLKLQARLGLTRHPLWEAITPNVYTTVGSLSSLGGQVLLTPAAVSTAPGRIASAKWEGIASSGPLYRVWAGIRDEYSGADNFLSLWECEDTDANVETGTTRKVDADDPSFPGSAGGWARVDLATYPTFSKRLTIRVSYVVADADLLDQIGTYQVLCRCRVGTGMTAALQLKSGAAGMADADHVANEIAYVTNTAYRLIELGEFRIPAWGNLTSAIKYTRLQLWAELLSGTGNLDLDCLVLIPALHYCKIEGAAISSYGVVPDDYTTPAYVLTHENDTTLAYAYYSASGLSPAAILQPTIKDWYFPQAGGLLVLAAERETAHVLGDTLGYQLQIYKRYLSYRAA